MAWFGQISTHMPHPMHSDLSMTIFSSPALSAGHSKSLMQQPHRVHSSEMDISKDSWRPSACLSLMQGCLAMTAATPSTGVLSWASFTILVKPSMSYGSWIKTVRMPQPLRMSSS